MVATHYHACDADPERRYVWWPIAIDPATIEAVGLSPRSPCFVCEAASMLLGEPAVDTSAVNAADTPETPVARVSLEALSEDARIAEVAQRLRRKRMGVMATRAATSAKRAVVGTVAINEEKRKAPVKWKRGMANPNQVSWLTVEEEDNE